MKNHVIGLAKEAGVTNHWENVWIMWILLFRLRIMTVRSGSQVCNDSPLVI